MGQEEDREMVEEEEENEEKKEQKEKEKKKEMEKKKKKCRNGNYTKPEIKKKCQFHPLNSQAKTFISPNDF